MRTKTCYVRFFKDSLDKKAGTPILELDEGIVSTFAKFEYEPEMSSDYRKSLNHSDPPLFFESWYQSRYQDCDLKSLDSSLDIKTQDFRVFIPVSISRLKFQKSWFQSRY